MKNSDGYKNRDDLLRLMGYSSYTTYLASPLWITIRTAAYSLHGHNCVTCGEKANQVHHVEYTRAVLEGKTLADVVPLCRQCHETVEFDGDERKRTQHMAKVQFRIMLRKALKRGVYRPSPDSGLCTACGDKLKKAGRVCLKCNAANAPSAPKAAAPKKGKGGKSWIGLQKKAQHLVRKKRVNDLHKLIAEQRRDRNRDRHGGFGC